MHMSFSVTQSSLFKGPSYIFYQQPEYPKDCHDTLNQCSIAHSSGVKIIKPNGYSDPFEVYCKSEQNSQGWTVSPYDTMIPLYTSITDMYVRCNCFYKNQKWCFHRS